MTARCTAALAIVLWLGPVLPVSAQLSAPNAEGVAMGHLHYYVRDVEANQRFWEALGGEATTLGRSVVVTLPGVLLFLSEGEPQGGTEGSILNHVAFRVQSLDAVAAAGFEFDVSVPSSGVTNVFTPEGERIELFDNTATNLTFTLDGGGVDAVAQRHNEPLGVPISSHHLHLYLLDDEEATAQAWYVEMFGGLPGTRWRYPAVDLPGINLNFSHNPDRGGAPTRGRMLDHIGFEVTDLEAFCRRLEAKGVTFDVPYARTAAGIGYAFLTDPWGVYIELTEGLRGL